MARGKCPKCNEVVNRTSVEEVNPPAGVVAQMKNRGGPSFLPSPMRLKCFVNFLLPDFRRDWLCSVG